MKGGEELNTMRASISKVLYLGAFLCVIAFVGSQLNFAGAADGDPCPKKENEKLYWCTVCNEIFTWNECGNLKYIWNTKEHKAGEEVATHKMVPSWSCLRTEYYCIRDGKKWSSNPNGIFCEGSKVCLPYNAGACGTCGDDLAPRKSRAKLDFKCTGCGKMFDEPGAGHEIDHKKEYAEHLKSFGNCKDCGKPLDSVCKMSGTCPHTPDF